MLSRWNRARWAAPVVLLVMMCLTTPGVATGASATPVSPQSDDGGSHKIEPRLLADLEKPGPTSEPFFIELEDVADLSAASRIRDWTARGEAVVKALRDTAEASQSEVISILEARGVEFRSFWINDTIYVPSGTRATAMTVAAQDSVAAVRAPDRVPLEKPLESTQRAFSSEDVEWGVAEIKADQVWRDLDDRGEGIVVANIDSGVQFDHPALVRSYRGNLGDGTFGHDYNWWDPSQICGFPSRQPCDNVGHGTHTMGTMIGDGGVGNRIGVAPGARWIAAKGCEFNGCSEAALASAAQWVLAPTDLQGQNPDPSKRPHIVNNSWSGPGGDDWYQDFVDAWVASGIFPVFSNGNEGSSCSTTGAPGEYVESYSVGDYAADGAIAPTSSRGPGTADETKPNISAPGTDVRSSVPRGGYALYSGTSMAAPHVSGTVALLWSAAPSLVGDIDATRQLLDDTARDRADGQCGGDADDNNVYGEGKLDALAVVRAAPRGEVGTLQGVVTDASTDDPIADARLDLTGPSTRSVVTKGDGSYSIKLTPGTHGIEATEFGFEELQVGDVRVTSGQTTTRDLVLTPAELVTLKGSVRDGSGHGWPLYANVSLPGTDLSTFTDPGSGRYALQVPSGGTYQVQTESAYPGYLPQTTAVPVEGDAVEDVVLDVDPATCTAPGYDRGPGLRESFDAASSPAGWTVTDPTGSGETWKFNDPGDRGNLTGGHDGFAVVDSDDYGDDGSQDTSLVSPVLDLSGTDHPVLEFASDFKAYFLVRADVDLSTDGGATWENVWRATSDTRGPGTVRIDLPGAAHQRSVQLRFHYYRAFHDWWWQVDDVFVGDRTCEQTAGGLLFGHTTSSLTGEAINGARVVSGDVPTDEARSAGTAADASVTDGLYWLFSSVTGEREFTASADLHSPRTARLSLPRGEVTRHDFALASARLRTDVRDIRATVRIGHKATRRVTIVNTGDGATSYRLEEHAAGGSASGPAPRDLDGKGAPLRRIRTATSPGPVGASGARFAQHLEAAEGPWTDVSIYPTRIKDSVAGYNDGLLYSFGGSVGNGPPLRAAYVYDPAAAEWRPVADMPKGRQKPAGAFIDGRFIVTGGWGEDDLAPVAATSIYDPEADSWSVGAPNPTPLAASGTAVLNGRLHTIGGCNASCSSGDASRTVMRYDPVADTWTRLADYPQAAAWASCGGIGGKVYCAGGIGPGTDSMSTYVYTPATDTWDQVADMPLDMWASAYAVASDRLIVAGGAANRSSVITNEAFAYDPAANTWRRLPNSNYALYRSAGACGFYKVGGSDGTFRGDVAVERLPGLTNCAPWQDFAWLDAKRATGAIEPGQRRTIKVTLDARRLTKPGTYTASLHLAEDTPFPVAAMSVTMVVTPRHRR